MRELENCVHRAVLLASGDEIGPEAILLQGGAPGRPRDAGRRRSPLVGRTVAEVERDLILDTLQHTLGNRTHAATILGISIRTLRNKLRQYGGEGVPVPPPARRLCDAATTAPEPRRDSADGADPEPRSRPICSAASATRCARATSRWRSA